MSDPESTPRSRLSGLRVLVAEDEMLLAMELIDELEELGAVPIGPIPTVAEALAVLERETIDAAMLNVHLRDQLSFPIADLLIEKKVPFLFVTGNDGFVRERFPSVPAHPKPYDMATVVDALELLRNNRTRLRRTEAATCSGSGERRSVAQASASSS